jgi:hypothetical protein
MPIWLQLAIFERVHRWRPTIKVTGLTKQIFEMSLFRFVPNLYAKLRNILYTRIETTKTAINKYQGSSLSLIVICTFQSISEAHRRGHIGHEDSVGFSVFKIYFRY